MFTVNLVLLLFAATYLFSPSLGQQCTKDDFIDCYYELMQETLNETITPTLKVENYDTNFGNVIAFKNLRSAMDALDVLRVNYSGGADLVGLRHTTNQLLTNYQQTTDDMFRWTMYAKTICDQVNDTVIANYNLAEQQAEPQPEQKRMLDNWKRFIVKIISKGHVTINRTVQGLNQTWESLDNLSKQLTEEKKKVIGEHLNITAEREAYDAKRKILNADRADLIADRLLKQAAVDECNAKRQSETTKNWLITTAPTRSCANQVFELKLVELMIEMPSGDEEYQVSNQYYNDIVDKLAKVIKCVEASKATIDIEMNTLGKDTLKASPDDSSSLDALLVTFRDIVNDKFMDWHKLQEAHKPIKNPLNSSISEPSQIPTLL